MYEYHEPTNTTYNHDDKKVSNVVVFETEEGMRIRRFSISRDRIVKIYEEIKRIENQETTNVN